MPYRYLLLSTLFIAGCYSSKINHQFIPSKYKFPRNEILKGKTFVFRDPDNGELSFTDLSTPSKDDTNMVIMRQYTLSSTIDSSIFNKEVLLESYSYSFPGGEMVKAELQEDTVIANGGKLGKHITSRIYKGKDAVFSMRVESEYLKDTTLFWKNKQLNTLITKSILQATLKNLVDTTLQEKVTAEYITYDSETIGTTKIITTIKNKASTRVLIEIKDTPN